MNYLEDDEEIKKLRNYEDVYAMPTFPLRFSKKKVEETRDEYYYIFPDDDCYE